MLGLFFDVRPKPGHMVHYFEHVDRLKPVLAGHGGLLYLERFRPLDDEGALLSHQHWADEAALAGWRREATHRASQSAGRRVHFEDYRIRVGETVADAGARGAGRFVVAAAGPAPTGGRAYESVTRAGRFLSLTEAGTGEGAGAIAEAARRDGADAVHVFAIARDYTLEDRAEAPRDGMA
ncbi:antibiotic biosynthesis monooxygenase [Roseibacterium sp. SDUM158017]|uniref:antibiotic biosynthesis monooxygenase family protein n=1 Tax=Roseicyclus salinarum TaxID=3036773 RepID=UPI0024157232|nr:antibiotic biosynthesis monooxygenase family protein [Roseibacterium sp. SDUM158017]MDG4648822.1 antibiotic biosynthesis monooxygenase [Roseibacterium sp. SDUM158017]